MRWSRILIACGLIAVTAGYVFVARWMISMIMPYRIGGLSYVSVVRDSKQPDRKALTLTFRSRSNLRGALADRDATFVIAFYRLCDSGIDVSSGYVLHKGIGLNNRPTQLCVSHEGGPMQCRMDDDTAAVRAEVAHAYDTGPETYEASFFYEVYCDNDGPRSCERYAPLPVPPREDICMEIRDTLSYGTHLNTNLVRIPKEDIAKALAARKP